MVDGFYLFYFLPTLTCFSSCSLNYLVCPASSLVCSAFTWKRRRRWGWGMDRVQFCCLAVWLPPCYRDTTTTFSHPPALVPHPCVCMHVVGVCVFVCERDEWIGCDTRAVLSVALFPRLSGLLLIGLVLKGRVMALLGEGGGIRPLIAIVQTRYDCSLPTPIHHSPICTPLSLLSFLFPLWVLHSHSHLFCT